MTLELLQERLQAIQAQIGQLDSSVAQLMANLNMLRGGEQEVLHWIKQLTETDDGG